MSRTIPSEETLHDEVVDRVLERFGVERALPDLDFLNELYAAWCRSVPFDNIYKRLYFAKGAGGPLPLGRSAEILEMFLRHGTGGTCWPMAIAQFALLRTLGFTVRGLAGSMVGITPPDFGPSHGTIIVTLDGSEYLVDNTMLSEEVLPLRRDTITTASAGGLRIWAEPNASLWDVHFQMAHSDREITCRLEVDGVSLEFFQERLQRTIGYSRFNQTLYIRKNHGGGAIAYGRGKLTRLDPSGDRTVEKVDQDALTDLLVNDFGLSSERVQALPPDDAAEEILG